MDNNKIDDDFLGESIDDIFDSKFEGKKNDDPNEKKEKHENIIEDKDEDLLLVDPDSEPDNKEDIVESEDDIYVLEENGVEVQPIEGPVQIEEDKKSDANNNDDDLTSFDMDDDFDLLEKEFDSTGKVEKSPESEGSGDFVLDLTDNNSKKNEEDPLDLENEFVNMKPPEKSQVDEDFDDFVVDNHNYEKDEEIAQSTPPPIPTIKKEGNEFILDPEFDSDIGLAKESDSSYSSTVENSDNDSFTLTDSSADKGPVETDGRFFNKNGRPVNDSEILKSNEESNLNKKEPVDSSDSGHGFDMQLSKKSKPVFEKNKMMIVGAAAFIIIIVGLYFIIPEFFGNSKAVKKKTTDDLLKKNIIAKRKVKDPKKVKEEADRAQLNKLFALAKKNFEEGKLEEAKENCRLALNIKRTDVLIFLEREINEKIESNKKKAIADAITKKDKNDYNRAVQNDSVNGFKDYIKKHPNGEYVGKSKSMIIKLEKRDYQNKLNKIVERSKTARKYRLRVENKQMNKKMIRSITEKRMVQNNYEVQVIDGDRVIIDYSTGLMWTMARYSMQLEKAKFWSVRHYAGYYNWRMPTSEEVYSLQGISSSLIQRKSINGISIWTGDGDIDSSHNWTFSLIDGKYKTSSAFKTQNLMCVRTIK